MKVCLTACAALCCTLASEASVSVRTVVLSGQSAPDLPGAEIASLLRFPIINDAGQVVFQSVMTGPGIDATNDRSVWIADGGTLELLVREGDVAPGTDGIEFYSGFEPLLLNNNGDVAFSGNLSGYGAGIWTYQGGALELVARRSDIAPGTGGATFGSVPSLSRNMVMNDSGAIIFQSYLEGDGINSTNNSGLWSYADGELELVVRVGDAVPGMPDTVYSSASIPRINQAGQIFFSSGIAGPGIDMSNSHAMWLIDSGTHQILARAGEVVPGTGGASIDLTTSGMVLNNAGRIVFTGTVNGITRGGNSMHGVWAADASGVELIARTGMSAPGVDGATFNYFYNMPAQNASGQTLFYAALSGDGLDETNNHGIWMDNDDGLSLYVRFGDSAPGIEGAEFSYFEAIMLGDSGQVAFHSRVVGEGIDFTNNYGLWASNTDDEIELLMRTGVLFDVNDDPLIEDLRVVEWIDPGDEDGSGSGSGLPRVLNSSGELVFTLRFTDLSAGVFVASLLDTVAGDINGDDVVDVEDLDVLLANWGDAVGQFAASSGDLSGDGVVGQSDLQIVLDHWGDGSPPDVNIPEPGTITILSVALMGLARRR